MRTADYLLNIYETLNDCFGNLNWWPGETPFEIAVGAILAQNTNWKNVERAIENLKESNLLSPEGLLKTEEEKLEELIRPSGYYRIKTKRLKSFVRFLFEEYDGALDKMFEEEPWALREKLLDVKGIGEETADSILLYAGEKPVFVVDAYTRRVLLRHHLINEDARYGNIQSLFMDHLPCHAPLFNQYHALFVNTGKRFCRKTPLCEECPLKGLKVEKLRRKGKDKGEL
jgi:endonuclease-3 related protein